MNEEPDASSSWVFVFLFFQLMAHLGVLENKIVRVTSLPKADY
jgi:hypothetical protein